MATQNRPRFQYEQSGGGTSFSEKCSETTVEAIRDFPVTSLLAAFGLGLGLGAAVGMMLIEPAQPTYQSRFEHLGRRMMDALSEVVPESVSHRVTG